MALLRTFHLVLTTALALFLLAAACDSEKPAPRPEPETSTAASASAATSATVSSTTGAATPPSAEAESSAAAPGSAAPGSAAPSSSAAAADSGSSSSGSPDKPQGGKDAAGFELKEAGAEPRKTLRLNPRIGQRETLRLSSQVAMREAKAKGKASPKAPETVITAALTLTGKTPRGHLRYDYSLTGASIQATKVVPKKTLATMNQALGKLKGLQGHLIITDRGFVLDTGMKTPPGMSAQAKQQLLAFNQVMRHFGVPLPADPVGIGARWQRTTRITQSGITLIQGTSYELTARELDRLTIKTSVLQTAKPQKITAMGTQVDLLSVRTTGGGNVALLLDRLVPIEADQKLAGSLMMKLSRPRKKDRKIEMLTSVITKINGGERLKP